MAVDLRVLERRLASADEVVRHRNAVLRDLTAAVNSMEAEPSPRAVHDLVLRALEMRPCFGEYAVVLDALVKARGLYPYLDPRDLSLSDLIAYEAHRPEQLDDVVLHRAQTVVYDLLLQGENVVLSAPTSFGKSLLIDAAIASGRYDNIVVVVPTIALIDETRRRLAKRFGDSFKVVTHVGQTLSTKNIFVLTQERVLDHPALPPIDLFVIDEFYKLDPSKDPERAFLLNQAFYRPLRTGAQFYLLGPNIKRLPIELPERLTFRFIATDYATVVSETTRITASREERLEKLVELTKSLDGPTLIYCASPAGARRVATALVGAFADQMAPDEMQAAAQWVGEHFHPDWAFGRALRHGIGLHHGRIPRALAQFAVRAFNSDQLRVLVCTSTLIEGVNTKAKNVVVYDNRVATQKFDYFTFNNIRGRSGRMFQHFVGRVYLFNEPPTENLPFVDVPVFTQNDETPTSLLIQLDTDDLTADSRRRIEHLETQEFLPLEVVRLNSGIDPDIQVALARALFELPVDECATLSWTGPRPTFDQLLAACDLIWNYFLRSPPSHHGVFSARQLAFRLRKYRGAQGLKQQILEEVAQQTDNPDADNAVEDVLDFVRYWVTFGFPRYLIALDRIAKSVFQRRELPLGDFTLFAARLENQYLPAGLSALEEYGLPVQVGSKLAIVLGEPSSLDEAISRLKELDLRLTNNLGAFERSLLIDTRQGI